MQKCTDSQSSSCDSMVDQSEQATAMEVGRSPSLRRKIKYIKDKTREISLEDSQSAYHLGKRSQRDISPLSSSSRSDGGHAPDQKNDRDLMWHVCEDKLLTDEEKQRQILIFQRLGQLTKIDKPLEVLSFAHARIENNEYGPKKKTHRARHSPPKEEELVASGHLQSGSKRFKLESCSSLEKDESSSDDSQSLDCSYEPQGEIKRTINIVMKGVAGPVPIVISCDKALKTAEVDGHDFQEAVKLFIEFLAAKDDVIIDENVMISLSMLEAAMFPCAFSYSERVSDFVDKVEDLHRFFNNKGQDLKRQEQSLESLNRFLLAMKHDAQPTFDQAVEKFKYVTDNILPEAERKQLSESSGEYFCDNFLGYRFAKTYIRQMLCENMKHNGVEVDKYDNQDSTVYRFSFPAVPSFDGLSGHADYRSDAISDMIQVSISLKDKACSVTLADLD